MPTALITPEALYEQPGPHVDRLAEAGFEVKYPEDSTFTRGRSPEETIAGLEGIDAILAGGERLTAEVMEGCPGLRVIARCGVGFDRVDIPAATRLGRVVTITPTANHAAVAEQALALLFGVSKRIAVHDKLVRSGGWTTEPMRPIRGQTMGIFGLGRIGRSMAVRCASLGMTVIATEKYPDEAFCAEQGIELVDFDTLLSRSDAISIHCPLNDETHGLFNADVLTRMKSGSVLINTARGKIIVESDLLEALQNGPLAAAGLDVFEQEPASSDNPLFALDNIVASPHLAGADTTSIQDMANEAADCIATLYEGDWPGPAVINPDVQASWSW